MKFADLKIFMPACPQELSLDLLFFLQVIGSFSAKHLMSYLKNDHPQLISLFVYHLFMFISQLYFIMKIVIFKLGGLK